MKLPCYLHIIYYEDNIFAVIYNLHVQGPNLAENLTNIKTMQPILEDIQNH